MNQISCGFLIKQNGKYLAMLPTGKQKNAKHSYDIPKGCKEKNESDFDTACRELLEETGIDLGSVEHSEYIDYGLQSYKPGKDVHIFGVEIELPDDFEIKCTSTFIDDKGKEKPEMCGYKWVTDLSYYFFNLEKVLKKIVIN